MPIAPGLQIGDPIAGRGNPGTVSGRGCRGAHRSNSPLPLRPAEYQNGAHAKASFHAP